MLKKIIFIFLLFFSTIVWADICEEAIKTQAEQGLSKAVLYYESCALSKNNDAAQMVLAKAYENGSDGLQKNMQKALLFYHLAAENGNAEGQVALAKLLLKLDENEVGRKQVQGYLSKMHAAYKSASSDEFKGVLLHPYTLLLLAAENPNGKWFYPSDVTSFKDAAFELKSYKITDAKKVSAMRDASDWKQSKMLQAAKELYASEEYQKFKETVMPSKGKADAFGRSQAIMNLQKKVKEYREQG